MSAQFITKDNTIRITVDEGRIYIKVLTETGHPHNREILDDFKAFIGKLNSDSVHISEIRNRKVSGSVGGHEPDCVVLRLV